MSDLVTDPLVLFPELGALRAAVQAGAWQPVAEYVGGWRGHDPQRVSAGAWTVAESEGAEAFLAAQDRTPLARALTATLRIHQAWLVRGRGVASTVSAEQWTGFRDHLVAAERELVELAALDPDDPLVAGLRLVTARGLSLGLSEVQRRWARLAAVSPDDIAAQSAQLQTLAPKWAGSTELMFEFARACLAEGRPGSSAGRLVAIAHYEHWLDLPAAESDRYAASDPVQGELYAAANASVFHPDYDPGITWVTDHSYFACLHTLGARPDLARRHFEALGPTADLDAWKYLADPRAAHDLARARAFAGAPA